MGVDNVNLHLNPAVIGSGLPPSSEGLAAGNVALIMRNLAQMWTGLQGERPAGQPAEGKKESKETDVKKESAKKEESTPGINIKAGSPATKAIADPAPVTAPGARRATEETPTSSPRRTSEPTTFEVVPNSGPDLENFA